ncbi:putative RNA methylase [Lipingzhangella halophila]|uniref:Putative RNA methylase n=1 Tax=Lipingzhangella halophila TaxID=1783352 RepID=A0A7W7W159_9ACTN|nr:class I SAM-dependent methyltransferase [Lipingzhangella halophila]MBB4929414.1 putative RNA methylase [Lipingzhangella halophila]
MPNSEHTAAFRALLTPPGQALLDTVDPAEVAADPLKAASRLRRTPEASDGTFDVFGAAGSEVVQAALTQARLRGRGREKFGGAAARMYFTSAGLEQATRRSVAEYRAGRLAAALGEGARVADLCCGIGADLLSMAAAGLVVDGVDADPLTVAVAAANIDARGLAARARAHQADAAEFAGRGGLGDYDAVFCDPARRGARGRVFDPHAYSPPWGTVADLARTAPAACVKAAPGIPHELVPEGAGAEWISVDGDVKEAALWFGALGTGDRRATLLRESGGAPATLAAEPGLAPPATAPPRHYLYEPDGAVIRAHLVAEAAALLDGALLDPHIAYITSDHLVETPFCRAYEVEEVLPFSLKRLRAALRARDAGTVTIKKRGSAVDVEKLRRDLKPAGPETAVVVLTRIGERPVSLVCSEVTGPLARNAGQP